jgi:predicted hydrolase (HD superfamily)
MTSNQFIGSFDWGIQTGGSLNSLNKINFSLKAISMRLNKRFSNESNPIVTNTIMELPDTMLVKQTLEYINDVHKEPLRNHCLRAYVIGDIFGQAEKLHYDKELYAVSALLHDLGLEDNFCCLHQGIDCFAIEGAKVAGDFLKEKSVSAEKVKIVEDAIAYHLNIQVHKPLAEAYLLNKASATDTVGLYRSELSDAIAQDIMVKYPRLDFNAIVHQMLKKQCDIRPNSRIKFLYANGFGGMLRENRFEKRLFS